MLIILVFAAYLAIRYFSIHEVAGKYEASALLNGEVKKLVTNYAILFARSLFPCFSNSIWLLYSFGVANLFMLFFVFKMPKRSLPVLLVLGLIFLISLVPYTSLGVDTRGTEAERFLYFPSVLYCLIVGFIIEKSGRNEKLRIAVALLLLGLHGIALENSSENYRLAGNVNKSVITELNKTKDVHTVYASSLPKASMGHLYCEMDFLK